MNRGSVSTPVSDVVGKGRYGRRRGRSTKPAPLPKVIVVKTQVATDTPMVKWFYIRGSSGGSMKLTAMVTVHRSAATLISGPRCSKLRLQRLFVRLALCRSLLPS